MSDKPFSADPLGQESRSRQGRTIDLEATEVRNADAQPEPPSDAQPASSAAAEDTPNGAAETSQSESMGQSESAAPAGPARPRAPSGWKALVTGGLSGAAIAAAITLAGFFIIRDTDLKELDTRLSRVESQLNQRRAAQAALVDSLAERVAGLEATLAKLQSAPLDVTTADRFTAVANDLKNLSARVDAVGQEIAGTTGGARDARQRTEANAAALAELANRVAAVADPSPREKIAAELGSLTDRLGALESKLNKARDDSGRLAVAAMALSAAVGQGQALAPELAAVKALGANPDLLGPLEPFAQSGVPSAATLSRELLDLIPSLRTTEPPRGTLLSRLQANAERLVRIRPQDEKQGTDVAAILDRTEIKASNADISGSIAQLEQLPPAVRARVDGWMHNAKARSAAVQASQRLLATAMAGLTK